MSPASVSRVFAIARTSATALRVLRRDLAKSEAARLSNLVVLMISFWLVEQ